MIKILDTFAGVGGFSLALEQAIWKENIEHIGYSEICPNALKVYKERFKNTKDFWDITKIDIENLPDFDLLTWGFPCQDVSVSGKQTLGGGRTILVEYLLRILEKKQPEYFIFENVKGLTSKKFKLFYESIVDRIKQAWYNLEIKILDSRNFWLPHIRTRIFLVWSINKKYEFPKGKDFTEKLEDFLYKKVDDKYYLNELQIEEAKKNRMPKTFHTGISRGPMKLTRNEMGYILALTKISFGKGNRQTNLVKDTKGIRILTGQEYEKLQWFPVGWASDILPEYLTKEVMGNAISVPVVTAIFKELFKNNF